MNSKAQFGMITFIGLILVMLFLAPIVIKIVRSSVGGFSDGLENVNSAAADEVDAIEDTFISLWDWVIFLMFGLNVIILLLSSFFIDTHPAFVIVYILTMFFMFAFAPSILDGLEASYNQLGDAASGHDSGAYLPITEFLINNFGTLMLSIAILSGIVMYAKFKYFT
jgi:hypothetical protein